MRIGGFEIRAKENTKWDYILPIGLSGIEALFFIFWAILTDLVEKEQAEVWGTFYRFDWTEWILFLFSIAITFVLLFLITKYLTRLQRILILPLIGFFSIFLGRVLWEAFYLLLGVLLYGIGYILGTLILYALYGNNASMQKEPKKPYPSLLRYAVLFGIVGSIIGAVSPILAVGGMFPVTLVFPNNVIRIIRFLPATITTPIISVLMNYSNPLLLNILFWALIFALLGIAIAKLKQKKEMPFQND